MEQQSHSNRWLFGVATLGLIFTLVNTSGCDTGTYGKRYAEREEQLRNDTTMSTLLGTNLLVELGDQANQGTGILMRHPSIFPDGEGVFGVSSVSGEPRRALPPGIQIPGFTYSQERFATAADSALVGYYVYHGVIPSGDIMIDEVESSVKNAVAAVIPNFNANFKDVEYPAIGGGITKWRELSIIAGQEFAFYFPAEGEIRYRQMDGRLIISLYTAPNYHVLLAWRVPAELAEGLNFVDSAKAAMGTIQSRDGDST